MIDVKQLRVGNIFQDDCGAVSILNGMKPFEDSVRCDEDGCILLYDYYSNGELKRGYECESYRCSPIVLSDEWLERLGYKFKTRAPYESQWRFKIGTSYFVLRVKNNTLYFDSYFGGLRVKVEWVHQVQNMVTSLTGKELTIKEPING